MTGCTVRRYEQLEISPETIEQKNCYLQFANTDIFKGNYSIDVSFEITKHVRV